MKEKDGYNSAELSSAELRKIRKPVIERKRRERINESLEELKVLLLQAYNRHEPQYTKMEKADILEMAVEHLQFLRTTQIARVPTPFELAQRYTLGFRECVQEVNRCLETTPGASAELKHRVLSHLGGCMGGMSTSNSILATQNHQANQNAAYLFAANQRQDYNQNTIGHQRTPAVCQVSPPNRTVIHVPKPIKLEPPPFSGLLSSGSTQSRRLSSESMRREGIDSKSTRRESIDSCHTRELKRIETIRPNVDLVESPEEVPSTSSGKTGSTLPPLQDNKHMSVSNQRTDYNQNLLVSKQGQNEAASSSGSVARRLEFQKENKQSIAAAAAAATASATVVSQGARQDNNPANVSKEEGKQDDSGVGSGFEIEDISEDEDDMWRPW